MMMIERAFEKTPIRIVHENDTVWFVAADIAAVLEIANVSQMVGTLEEDEKGICKTYTSVGERESLTISESGLYTLLIRSNKEQAKPFRRWVTHEVLPSIRKTGGYSTKALTPAEQNLANAQLFLELERQHERTVTRIDALENRNQLLEANNKTALTTAEAAFKTAEGNYGYYSILGFAKRNGKEITKGQASAYGRKVTKYCKGLGVGIKNIGDTRHGFVNTYPESALKDYFVEYGW